MTVEGKLSRADYGELSRFRFQIRRFLHFSEEAARAEGLEPQQHQMLLAMAGLEEEPTVGRLAEQLLIRHHSAVELLDRLEQRGLVERARDAADRRQVRAAITEAGWEKLRRLAGQHRAELRRTGPALVEALRAVIEDAE